jgi:hypothetical protein
VLPFWRENAVLGMTEWTKQLSHCRIRNNRFGGAGLYLRARPGSRCACQPRASVNITRTGRKRKINKWTIRTEREQAQ